MAVLDWMILKVLSNFDDSMVLDVLMFQSLYGNIRFRGLRGNLRHEKCNVELGVSQICELFV